jgi:hypothetical protein
MTRRGVVLMLFGLLAIEVAGATGAEAWRRFVHPTQGFALSYPADWELVSRQGIVGVAVVGPEIPGTDGMHLSVSVASENLPQAISLDQYESVTESKIALIFNGYQRLRTDRTLVGGRPAILRYYTWKRNDGVGIYQMQLYTLAGRRAYVVTATTITTSLNLAQEAALLRRIMLTFKPGT